MESPALINWGADRYVPFVRSFSMIGYDFTGATFAAQVRDRKDGGALRADLGTVTTSAQGVRLIFGGTNTVANHITSNHLTSDIYNLVNINTGVKYVAADNVVLSYLRITINEATMEAMPFGTDIGDDKLLYWDLHITPSGGTKDLYVAGDFLVRAGVTQ